jgi:hypothetical protein
MRRCLALLGLAALSACATADFQAYRDDCFEIVGGALEFDCDAYTFSTSGVSANVRRPGCPTICFFSWTAGIDYETGGRRDGKIDEEVGLQIRRRNPGSSASTGTIHAGAPQARGRSGAFVTAAAIWTDCDENGEPRGEPAASRIVVQPFTS